MGTLRDQIEKEHYERSKQNTCRDKIEDMLRETLADAMKVFDFGALKHPDSGDIPNFLTEDGNKCSLRDRGSSCLRHSAELMTGRAADEESGLSPALHLIASSAILYIRQKRNIVHTLDKET